MDHHGVWTYALRAMATPGVIASLIAATIPLASGQDVPGVVDDAFEISEGLAGFTGDLDPVDSFGFSVEAIGDLDGDGVPDLAVGTDLDEDGGIFSGATWILFMQADGTVKSQQKISELEGGFGGNIEPFDRFGSGVAALGDLDGDGVRDIAVGAFQKSDGVATGVVYILFLQADGFVKSAARIDSQTGPLLGQLEGNVGFGRSVEALGDLDGDGVVDIAVGAWKDDANGGAVWILFLDMAGGVVGAQRIADGEGGFDGPAAGNFGIGTARLGDLDGDGVTELAVGANAADIFRGEVWVLFLNSDGTVKASQRIADGVGGFDGGLDIDDLFGTSLTALRDTDRDGLNELAVGAVFDSDGASDAGAAWILDLDVDGRVLAWQKISDTEGGFDGGLTSSEYFGSGIANIDTDGNGRDQLAIGAANDNDFIPDPETGSVWMVTLNKALWRDHGMGLAGAAGTPRLVGAGSQVGRKPTELNVTGAAPGAFSVLVIGFSQLELPFRGGTLFPSPDVLVGALSLNGEGEWKLGFPWPNDLPNGFDAAWQVWVADPTGPAGFSATNGISSRTR